LVGLIQVGVPCHQQILSFFGANPQLARQHLAMPLFSLTSCPGSGDDKEAEGPVRTTGTTGSKATEEEEALGVRVVVSVVKV